MEELYTFSSHQLQAIKRNENKQSLQNSRKKILSCNIVDKYSPRSKVAPLVQNQNQKGTFRRKSFKKVQFALPIQKVVEDQHISNNQNRFRETGSFVFRANRENYQINTEAEKNMREGIYHIRPIRTLNKRAFSAVPRRQSQHKYDLLNEIKQSLNENVQRKQKKSTSLKLSPKINFPSSNRKLPSAFKSKFGERYLQKFMHNQRKQHTPKNPLVCQNQIYFDQSRQTLSQEIQKFKKRLMVENKLLQKLSKPV